MELTTVWKRPSRRSRSFNACICFLPTNGLLFFVNSSGPWPDSTQESFTETGTAPGQVSALRESRLSNRIKHVYRERIPHVVAARVCGPFSLILEFDDGVEKRVNLRRFLRGPIFEPLLDPTEFAKVFVDHEAGTIAWPNEADFAPETLYELPEESDPAA